MVRRVDQYRDRPYRKLGSVATGNLSLDVVDIDGESLCRFLGWFQYFQDLLQEHMLDHVCYTEPEAFFENSICLLNPDKDELAGQIFGKGPYELGPDRAAELPELYGDRNHIKWVQLIYLAVNPEYGDRGLSKAIRLTTLQRLLRKHPDLTHVRVVPAFESMDKVVPFFHKLDPDVVDKRDGYPAGLEVTDLWLNTTTVARNIPVLAEELGVTIDLDI